jgi:hypothetical protein
MKICYYNGNKEYTNSATWPSFSGDHTYFTDMVLSGNSCTGFTVNEKFSNSGYKFIRFTLAGTAEDSIITINEEIID